MNTLPTPTFKYILVNLYSFYDKPATIISHRYSEHLPFISSLSRFKFLVFMLNNILQVEPNIP